MFYADGSITSGLWRTEVNRAVSTQYLEDGYVEMKMQDGSSYNGNYANGEFNGRGIYRWKNGASIEVEWVDSQINGYGIHIKPDGTQEEGQFLSNSDGTFSLVND
jgi:hypothetical protein